MKIRLGQGEITLNELANIVGGECILGEGFAFSHICTDSREADEHTLFVAMRGERVDGHDFIAAAAQNGCKCVLCEHAPTEKLGAVVVKDSIGALLTLAGSKKAAEMTVAITGSVGKTTTKEFVAAALAAIRPYKTEGNFNSVIGLPLSMLEMERETPAAVLEMGMSGFSEIEAMSLAARPDIAIITNIGSSHMEMLGSRENIRKAKLEIVAGLAPSGTLLINGDDPMLWKYETGARTLAVGVENSECDFFAANIKQDTHGTSFTAVFPDGTRESCYIAQFGLHNVRAALFGIAVAQLFGIDPIIAKNGVAAFHGAKMRQNIYCLGELTFIEDCYNASPESMRAAIDVCVSLKNARALAVLGDMKELGDTEAELHFGVGKYAAEQGIDTVFSFGELAESIANGAESGGANAVRIKNADAETAANAIISYAEAGDIILFKASRAMRAEKIIDIIKTKAEEIK